ESGAGRRSVHTTPRPICADHAATPAPPPSNGGSAMGMRGTHARFLLAGPMLGLALLAQPVLPAVADDGNDGGGSSVRQTNLVSDQAGMARTTDAHLVNPWGLAASPTGPWWVADNGTGVSTVYNAAGQPLPSGNPLVVTIPPPAGSSDSAAPTGLVFNGGSGFVISQGGHS